LGGGRALFIYFYFILFRALWRIRDLLFPDRMPALRALPTIEQNGVAAPMNRIAIPRRSPIKAGKWILQRFAFLHWDFALVTIWCCHDSIKEVFRFPSNLFFDFS
jgi:hypothetical protein